MARYNLHCEILTPVHIGTGEQIEPFDYLIRDHTFYRISLPRLIGNLGKEEQRSLTGLIEKSDLNGIRTFIGNNVDFETHCVYETDVSHEVETIYMDKINDIHNQLLISPFIRTDRINAAYIPGSSLKGSIRTAILNERGKSIYQQIYKKSRATLEQIPRFKRQKPREGDIQRDIERNVEKYIFDNRDAKNDPFRAISIADAYLPDNSTTVTEVKNTGRDRTGNLRSISIQMFTEVTHSTASDHVIEFETELVIDHELQSTSRAVSRTITMQDIIDSCNNFYIEKMRLDDTFFRNSRISPTTEWLLNEAKNKEEGSFFLRVGRFSGIFSVTLDEPYRNPRPPSGKAWGKTRNLAQDLYPMGWVKATVSEI
jgi:CRISPR-associated protein Csm5